MPVTPNYTPPPVPPPTPADVADPTRYRFGGEVYDRTDYGDDVDPQGWFIRVRTYPRVGPQPDYWISRALTPAHWVSR
jgi:hypothetical protein